MCPSLSGGMIHACYRVPKWAWVVDGHPKIVVEHRPMIALA
jgi:hypothetical protein